MVKLVCEMCVLHDAKLAPAERSYTGKLGVKLNRNGPNEEKCITSLNTYRHDWLKWSVQIWMYSETLRSGWGTVFVYPRDTPHCTSFGVLVDSVGVFAAITKELDWILIRALWSHHLWEAHALSAAALILTCNCNVEIRAREHGSNGAKWKERECLGLTHSAASQDCAQSARKSTFWTFSNTLTLMA